MPVTRWPLQPRKGLYAKLVDGIRTLYSDLNQKTVAIFSA